MTAYKTNEAPESLDSGAQSGRKDSNLRPLDPQGNSSPENQRAGGFLPVYRGAGDRSDTLKSSDSGELHPDIFGLHFCDVAGDDRCEVRS